MYTYSWITAIQQTFAYGLLPRNTPRVGRPVGTHFIQLCMIIGKTFRVRWMIGIDGERERQGISHSQPDLMMMMMIMLTYARVLVCTRTFWFVYLSVSLCESMCVFWCVFLCMFVSVRVYASIAGVLCEYI